MFAKKSFPTQEHYLTVFNAPGGSKASQESFVTSPTQHPPQQPMQTFFWLFPANLGQSHFEVALNI